MINYFIKLLKIFTIILFPLTIFFLSFYKIERKISVKGIIKSGKQDIISATIKDTIVNKIYCKEGQKVKQGDIIIEALDLQGFKDKYEVNKEKLNNLQEKFSKYQNIYKSGNISKLDFEKLKSEVIQYEIILKSLEKKIELLKFRAPYDGQIVNIFVKEHEKLTIGKKLFHIIKKGDLFIDTYIPERLYLLVKNRQKVYIKSNLYNYMKYQIYHGIIVYISDFGIINPKTNLVEFKITIKLLDGIKKLKVNSSVQCEIVRDNVSIPHYIFSKD